jgi:hypothetical protein
MDIELVNNKNPARIWIGINSLADVLYADAIASPVG